MVFLIFLLVPCFIILLAAEIKSAVEDSTVYKIFFERSATLKADQDTNVEANTTEIKTYWHRIRRRVKAAYRDLRKSLLFPPHRRGGIRLVTALDIEQRRYSSYASKPYLTPQLTSTRLYRIKWAIVGVCSCILTISGIEVTLKWNKISDIYSVATIGQYVPLMIGIGSLISVCWNLIHQEGVSIYRHKSHTVKSDSFIATKTRS